MIMSTFKTPRTIIKSYDKDGHRSVKKTTSSKQVNHLTTSKGHLPARHPHPPTSYHLPRPPHRPKGYKHNGRECIANTARSRRILIKNAKTHIMPAIHQVHESALCPRPTTSTNRRWSPSAHMGESTVLVSTTR